MSSELLITREVGNGLIVYKNSKGLYHRVDGPAVEWVDGTKEWWLNNQYHRTDGPAVEFADGAKHWWMNGQRHRIDGPSIEYTDGYKEWHLNGKKFSKAKFIIWYEVSQLKEYIEV